MSPDTATIGMVHTGDPATSHAAAAGVRERLTETQERVHEIILSSGMDGFTDDELHHRYRTIYGPCGHSTARQRRVELRDLGKVVDTGRTRLSDTGKPATVWADRFQHTGERTT